MDSTVNWLSSHLNEWDLFFYLLQAWEKEKVPSYLQMPTEGLSRTWIQFPHLIVMMLAALPIQSTWI